MKKNEKKIKYRKIKNTQELFSHYLMRVIMDIDQNTAYKKIKINE